MNGYFFSFIVADYKQNPGGGTTRGWAIFGVLSCMYRNFLLYFIQQQEFHHISSLKIFHRSPSKIKMPSYQSFKELITKLVSQSYQVITKLVLLCHHLSPLHLVSPL